MLSDDEIEVVRLETAAAFITGVRNGSAHLVTFARAIEAAVIARLAQGVSIEPTDMVYVQWRGTYEWIIPGGDYYTLEQLKTEIAAARVQALEEAAKVCDSIVIEHGNWKSTGHVFRRAIRALIGK